MSFTNVMDPSRMFQVRKDGFVFLDYYTNTVVLEYKCQGCCLFLSFFLLYGYCFVLVTMSHVNCG